MRAGSGGIMGDGGGIFDWLPGGDKQRTKGTKRGRRVRSGKSSKRGPIAKSAKIVRRAGSKAFDVLSSGAKITAKAGGGMLKNATSAVLKGGKTALGLLGLGGGAAATGTTAATGGGLMATIGSALGPIAGLLGSGAAGYGIGTLINKGIGKLTGGGEGWLGNAIWDVMHPKNKTNRNLPSGIKAPKQLITAKRPSIKPISKPKPPDPALMKPQVIVQPVPMPTATQPQASYHRQDGSDSAYNIPTQFDDTTLMLLALDRI